MRDDAHDITKIGITKNPKERIATLIRNYPFKSLVAFALIETDFAKDIEDTIKEKYKELRTNGEYYHIDTASVLEDIFNSKKELKTIIFNVKKHLAGSKPSRRVTPAQRKSASKSTK